MYGECLFLDVGQGSANVVIIDDRRVLLLDTGPHKKSILHNLLRERDFESIDVAILSHNDRDHIQGWEQVIREHATKIRAFYILQDRTIQKGSLFDYTMYLVNSKRLPGPSRAELASLANPKNVWEFGKNRKLRLELLYPDVAANFNAQLQKKANRTSAIAMLSCHGKRILFPGDSPMGAWRRIRRERPDLFPLSVAVLVVPHHGGFIGLPTELTDFFTEILRPETAVISVGTHNKDGHPNHLLLDALRKAKVRIMCTQVTSQCHDALPVDAFAPGVLENLHSYSISNVHRGTMHIACAGTVVASLDENGIEVHRQNDHFQAINSKLRSPKCIQRSGTVQSSGQ